MRGPVRAGALAANLRHDPTYVPPSAKGVEVDAVTQRFIEDLFARLKGLFPAWRNAWPSPEEYRAAQAEWLGEFIRSGIRSEELIQNGIRMAARQRRDFVPSAGQFVSWCLSPEAFGMPSVERAYRQAMRNTHPAQAGMARWSHPAIYHAAVACGYLHLQRLDRRVGMELFESKYFDQVRRVARGEELPPAPVAALPERLSKGSPEVARAALAAIRQRLGRR